MAKTLTVNKEGLIYLACPYSHDDHDVRVARFDAVNLAAGRLMHEGHYVFSPISHTHPISEVWGLPTQWSYWMDFCKLHLKNCYAMLVLRLDGWDNSIGIAAETQISRNLSQSLGYLDSDYGTNLKANTEIFLVEHGQTNSKARSKG